MNESLSQKSLQGRRRIFQVAVLRVSQSFDYLPGETGTPERGMRVEVRVRGKRHLGVVTRVQSQSRIDPRKLLKIDRCIDEKPILDKHFMQLSEWIAQYYHYPICKVLRVALPRLIRSGVLIEENKTHFWSASDRGNDHECAKEALKNAPQQKAMLQFLANKPADSASLRKHFPAWRQKLEALSKKGLVQCKTVKPEVLEEAPAGQLHSLSKAQATVVQDIIKQRNLFHCSLLEGVTGSGKTEVYLALATQIVSGGGQVMILLPEISLLSQTQQRFRECLGPAVVCSHSGMNDRQRSEVWQKMALGSAKVVIGPRSTVFTPCKNLQMIVVDEEHDLSYKQQDTLRYHARDLAIKRAQLLDIPVLLGSATPSLESLSNALEGKYKHYQLPRRIGGARMPVYRVLDVRGKKLQAGLSKDLIQMIQACLARGEQALLFLNRRGYAPKLMCRDCGEFMRCPACELPLTYHLSNQTLRCHHCGYCSTRVDTCPHCGKCDLVEIGYGTERIEEKIAQLFPDTEIVRVDTDTTRRKGQLEDRLSAIREGSAKILIGTQLLSKGHHFPKVTLVGLINVDQGLFAFDFRALERLGQQIIQVSGRAGREGLPGTVVLQTYHPDRPEMHILLEKGYRVLARLLLKQRKRVRLPPYHFLALFRAESKKKGESEAFLRKLVNRIRYHKVRGVVVFDPVPSPVEKKAGFYRAQLMLMADQRTALNKCLAQAMPKIEALSHARGLSWHLDVDPMEID